MFERLPVVVVGAGAMGRHWIRLLITNPHARPVGIVDLDLELASRVAREESVTDAVVGTSLAAVARDSGAAAVINVAVPAAHRSVNEQGLRLGLPVLCEKPLAPTLSDALRQVAVANVTGQLLMVSQSRRYFNHLAALRDVVGTLGPLGTVTQEFFHEDHEPGFREQMAHPLLVDMSIHHFDAMRYATGDEPVSVRCTSWNPPWSWYQGDASATAEFELRSGARFVYSGSRCAPGLPTSWNAAWRVQCERGAAVWDGDAQLTVDAGDLAPRVPEGVEELAGSVAAFAGAVRSGRTPENEVRSNVLSLAMVEAAVESSARGGERVIIADLLETAYAQAVQTETGDDISAELQSWGNAQAGISVGHWGATGGGTARRGSRG
ncbi:Gfo/Idh/MocA family protein [Sinomonas sp. P47F7]|uniref:Gfo/Idh/MocA family protein n=1 Tax=Sinomonas sp. P47F7 TaxID=3410987 RepID=UPI003BF541C0